MRRNLHILFLAIAATALACGGCDIDEKLNIITVDGGTSDVGSLPGPGSDAGASDDADGTSQDGGDDVDMGSTNGDMGAGEDMAALPDMNTSDDVCGDGMVGMTETCDDGNTDDGDYCAGDCSAETGGCGDGATQSNEACDDGNTDDGDYCAADCGAVTGSCGDGTLQGNESCDDAQTTDCAGTHDGGDGACVPVGTCSNGYSPDGSGNCVSTNTTGLPTPCSNGPGQTLFRFHYDSGSTSARIDVWDAACSYSFAPGSACNVYEVYPGFGDVGTTSEGYPILTSSEYIRVRYSVAGINFSQATLYVRARSYSTGSSTDIEAWSPIYGGVTYGPVDNDFVYDWYPIDWSNSLSPSDDPNLTAIQLYAYQGSNSLAVRAVELCLQ